MRIHPNMFSIVEHMLLGFLFLLLPNQQTLVLSFKRMLLISLVEMMPMTLKLESWTQEINDLKRFSYLEMLRVEEQDRGFYFLFIVLTGIRQQPQETLKFSLPVELPMMISL